MFDPLCKRFVISLATSCAISPTTKASLLSCALDEASLTPRLLDAIYDSGLERLLPVALQRLRRVVRYTLPPLNIFDYLPEPTPLCLHLLITNTGTYKTLYIGEHPASPDCIPLYGMNRARSAKANLTCFQGYELRELAFFNNNDIEAITANGSFLLRKGAML